MAATQTVFLKHTFIGKSKQDQPYTARAHSRYIQRESATHSVYTHLMPENYKARQRWFFDHENGLRKNGRVIDKFTISIPHEISQEHAIETLAQFGMWLGQDRCPFMFTLQGFESPNHHAHFVFIDKDFETGERIVGTTERNSTRGIKLEWERVANDMFEKLGYDIRVKVKEGYEQQAENDNFQTEAPQLPDDLREDEAFSTPVSEDAHGGDIAMAETTHAAIGVDAAGTIKFLHDQVSHLNFLHHCQSRLKEANDRVAYLEQQRASTSLEAGAHEASSVGILMASHRAQERLSEHQRSNGQLKGRALSVFGFTLFRTSARKKAEVVAETAKQARMEADTAEYKRRSYDLQLKQLDTEKERAMEVAYAHQAQLENLYGNEKEIDEAEGMIVNGIREATLAVHPQQALEAFESGEITVDEYRSYLHESGMDKELQDLEARIGLEEDGGQSL